MRRDPGAARRCSCCVVITIDPSVAEKAGTEIEPPVGCGRVLGDGVVGGGGVVPAPLVLLTVRWVVGPVVVPSKVTESAPLVWPVPKLAAAVCVEAAEGVAGGACLDAGLGVGGGRR